MARQSSCMRAPGHMRRIDAARTVESLAVERLPLVRRSRPGPSEITQRIDWEVPEGLGIQDVELDALERLLGSDFEPLLRQTQ